MMCSRGTIKITTVQMGLKLSIPLRDTARQWEHPHPNTGEIFPDEFLPTIVLDGKDPVLAIKRWGIESSRDGKLMRNARAETVDSLPTWQYHFQRRRCVVPFTGFIEWGKTEWSSMDRCLFSLDEQAEEPMLLAGIYDETHRLVIITTEANQIVAPVHPRMPAILADKTAMEIWLHPSNTFYGRNDSLRALKRLLVPYQGILHTRPLERVA